MKLLDAASVKTGTGNWTRGWDSTTRECGGITVYLSECDPDLVSDVIGDSENLEAGESCGYRVTPFGIVASLVLPTRAAQEDDETWLAGALRNAAEIPVARGLLLRQGTTGETWIGNPDVHQIAAPTLTDKAATQKAVSDARAYFFANTFALDPILHVNPGSMLALRDAGVIVLDPVSGDDRTVWGDPVVVSQGYYDIPGLTATPAAFFTGPIEITLSEVKTEDVVRSVRQNKVMYQVTMLAAIDTAPCAMVRIGPAPVAV